MVLLMPQPRRPKKNWICPPSNGTIADSIREFWNLFESLRKEYPHLIDAGSRKIISVNIKAVF